MTEPETDPRTAFYAGLARSPQTREAPSFPPGVAGKRRKPWLAKRARLARTLRAIVPWTPAFFPEVVDLWVASWAKTMPAIDFEARRGWFVDHLIASTAKGAEIAVAVVETGEVVGFVMIEPASGWLDQIAVHPDQWGAGIAEALIAAAQRLSPSRVALDVNADNPRAVAFYAHQGFVETGRGQNPRSGLPTLMLEWRPPT